MHKYDVISIVGIPRSGTTFLWQILKTVYSQGLADLEIKQQHALSTGENPVVGTLMRYGGDPWSYVRELRGMWLKLLGDDRRTFVFKQPQLVFFPPPEDLNVFTICCDRLNFEHWKQSWLEHGGHGQIDAFQRPADYLKEAWCLPWGEPEDVDKRIRVYYDRYREAGHLELVSGRDNCLWEFENPDAGLERIWNCLELDRGHLANVRPLFKPRRRN